MPEEPKSPLDDLLDVFVFAPLGLAKTIRDAMPGLAAQGRKEFESQTTVARMMGQYAVKEGRKNARRQARKVAETLGGLGVTLPGTASPAGHERKPEEPRDHGTAANGKASGAATPPRAATARPPVTPSAPPPSDHLAIPGYDTLSASQVVQRLAGLAGDELEAVRAYEEATRGRRTILSKIGQLQADRG